MIQANLLLSRHFIKINACLIGYGLWILLSQHQIITSKIKAPLCFYKIPENISIIAPDTVDLVISSQKRNLQNFDAYNSAIHLDASTLTLGNNDILLQKENLFLPDEINLINLVPSSIQIQLQKAE
ncbi:hypothetical protein KBC04_01390 [Candidatus Babeliales bacterium]|nr:hypothetical protein [Candidatus Babeliales bacterium]MBP9843626.1 hypothetical protein [Candidatus Babeliales bacterium]